MGKDQGALVKEEQKKMVIPNHRSLYFKEEFIKERDKDNRWLTR